MPALPVPPSPTAIVADAALPPGRWDVVSTAVDLSIPGLPGFVARMIRGKAKAEHKRLAPGEGVAALLAPDPKAKCRIDGQSIADGRYDQRLTCPQKQGEPMHVARAGRYDGTGFAGRATVTGVTPRGPLRIVLEQHAARIGD